MVPARGRQWPGGKAKRPRRSEDPGAQHEVHALLPEFHSADSRQGHDEDDNREHPGIPGGDGCGVDGRRTSRRLGCSGSTAKSQYPWRKEKPDGYQKVRPVLPDVTPVGNTIIGFIARGLSPLLLAKLGSVLRFLAGWGRAFPSATQRLHQIIAGVRSQPRLAQHAVSKRSSWFFECK